MSTLEDTDEFEEVSTIQELGSKDVTAKKIYQSLNQEKRDWFENWRARREMKSKDSMIFHLQQLLQGYTPPISKYPKPIRSMLWFAIKKIPLKYIIGSKTLLDWTGTKNKVHFGSKKRNIFANYRKYFRRSSSFGRRRYSRRSSFPRYRRRSYSRRSSLGFRRYSRRSSGYRRYSRY